MSQLKFAVPRTFSLLLTLALFVVMLAIFPAGQVSRAQNDTPPRPDAQMASPNAPAPLPQYTTPDLTALQPGILSSTLSYYFIAGNTFTPDGSVGYTRQVTGCVNQMPLNIGFSAPVQLPNGSQVVSITAYTYDSISTTTTGRAYFILNDGKGVGGYTVSAESSPNTIDYQQKQSTENNPIIINNKKYNYIIQWRKIGSVDSTLLSLCGVRVEYYAPMGAVYLPGINR